MAYRLGIVGHEAAKFTPETEELARQAIRRSIGDWINPPLVQSCVVSGACHLGGIDIWAVEEAKKLGIPYKEYPPRSRQWSGGYKERNIQIAEDSDRVICIVVAKYPPTHKGMRFDYCYHCGTSDHIKSGGCWTTKFARSLGKDTETIVI